MTQETQSQKAEQTVWKEPQNVSDEYERDRKEQERLRQENSRYLKIKDGEQVSFVLTGRCNFYNKVFEGDSKTTKMYDFELAEKNLRGENRIFSISVANVACGELISAIKNQKLHITIKRKGINKNTTYMVISS